MNNHSLHYYLIGLSLLLTSFCVSQEEQKKDSLNYEMQEVVIVGTRTSEKIIDIPYSVFRVDKSELSYGKKTNAKDVLTDVPGLFLQSRYGNNDLRISIRGFGTRSNSGERGVRILQDGIPESDPDGETVIDAIDFTSLGAVEVVKGNLSSLYANAPGGVVNFMSDLYFLKNYVSSTNQLGAFGLRMNGVKFGIANDNNRLLFSYNYRNLDGYRAHSQEYQHLINSIYEGDLGKRSTITLLANWVDGLNKLPGPLTKAEFDADPFQANPLAVAQDYKNITKKGRLAVKYKTAFDEDSHEELELIGYGGVKELEKADNDIYSLSTRYSLGATAKYSSKFDIADLPNILTVGLDYAYQSGPVTEFDNIYGNQGISVQNEYDASLSNIGLFFLDHFTILPETFSVLFSGRYDQDVFKKEIYIPYGLNDTSRTFQKFTPKLGLNYKVTPIIALYTSYGLSYDFPALNELNNSPLSSNISYSLNPDLNAQTSYNFEAGIKGNVLEPESEYKRLVFFELTYFNYLIHDEIVPFVINQKTYFRNAAKTNREGVEIGIKVEPAEHLELIANYTYAHFKYDDYLATIYSPSGTSTKDYANNAVPSVPKHILNFIVTYEWEINNSLSGMIQWDNDYISSMYVNDANTESAPGYFYGNILGGVNISLPVMNIVAYAGVNNIFDKRYAGFINVNDYYGQYYETGEPRNIYSGLKITFSK